jgi:HK97 family phage prohead protease
MKNFIPFSYQIKDLTEKGLVTFYANAFGVTDSDYDISAPGSFKKTLKDNGSRLRHFKYHDTRLMPGVIVEAKEDEIGLLISSQLILETQLGRETYEEYKALAEAGKQMEHSVGVNAIKYEKDDKKGIRTVNEWKLWEVSTLTAWGANPGALAQSVKEMGPDEVETEIAFLRGLLNIKSYDELKLEEIEKQMNYLQKVKAVLGAADLHSESNTLIEWRNMLNLKNK